MFGDDHTDPRQDVIDRLHSVIPKTADVVVIEHAEKGDGEPKPSPWAWLLNPSLLVMQLLTTVIQLYTRSKADRVVSPEQTTVPEEVATDLEIPTKYTDIAHTRRVLEQPWYLTGLSWAAVFACALGLLVHPGFILLSMIAIPGVGVLTQRIHNRMREAKMAADLREIVNDHSEIVFFAGDSHLKPIQNRLDGDITIVETSDSRP